LIFSEIIKIIKRDGWYLVTTKGSHRQFKHPFKPGRVTIAGKQSKDLTKYILYSILKQAGISKNILK